MSNQLQDNIDTNMESKPRTRPSLNLTGSLNNVLEEFPSPVNIALQLPDRLGPAAGRRRRNNFPNNTADITTFFNRDIMGSGDIVRSI